MLRPTQIARRSSALWTKWLLLRKSSSMRWTPQHSRAIVRLKLCERERGPQRDSVREWSKCSGRSAGCFTEPSLLTGQQEHRRRGVRWHCLKAPLKMLALSALLALGGRTAISASESIWAWNVQCGASALFIELRLDGRSIHHVAVPICRQPGSQQSSAAGTQRVSFSVTPSRAIIWHGYRDREDVTAAGAPLAIELSQAGADADTLMLVVAASDPLSDSVYMKTVHVAKVDKNSATDIARGLIISSRPYRLRPH